MTNISKEDLLIQVESELCSRDLYYFFKEATKVVDVGVNWHYNWHYKYLCNLFQDEVTRINEGLPKDKDYIINIPFRSGKSTLISIILPVWIWIKNPSAQILTVAATDALAVKFSHKSKLLIESTWFKQRFGHIFELRVDAHAKGNYMTDLGGVRQAFGINSTIIGSGGNYIICDDLNDPQSVTQLALNNVFNNYLDVLYTRLNNPNNDIRIILQQRTHELDITGYLLKNHKEKYNHICLPVEATKDLNPPELINFYEDGLFDTVRFSRKLIQNFKETMRAQPFSSQLMQSPNPEEGVLIKRNWFNKVKWSEIMDLKLQWNMVIDTAYTEKKDNDPSAFMLCAKYNNKLYIRKSKTYWLEFHKLITEIKEWVKVYGVRSIYIEGKASGKSIIQELKRQTNYAVIEMQPMGDKIERVNTIQPQLEAGDVYLVEDEWNGGFLAECAAFPLAAHDDQVDCLTYAVTNIFKKDSKVKMLIR